MAAPLRHELGHKDAFMVRLISAAVNAGDRPQKGTDGEPRILVKALPASQAMRSQPHHGRATRLPLDKTTHGCKTARTIKKWRKQ
jgi:hypothetical protein